uniref:Uncharacterized protein n=1 Tax=Panagrolaimus sp. ES5 TaxID=591445 RepID=A0AC34G1W3_9BILA
MFSDFCDILNKDINGILAPTTFYNMVTDYFKIQQRMKYFVFVFFDGSKLQDFEIGSAFSFEEFLDAIFCIGVEKAFIQPYNLLNIKKKNNGNITKAVKSVFDKNCGIISHIAFPFITFNDAILRKASMTAALQKDLLNSCIAWTNNILSMNTIKEENIAELGTIFLKKLYRSFKVARAGRIYECNAF